MRLKPVSVDIYIFAVSQHVTSSELSKRAIVLRLVTVIPISLVSDMFDLSQGACECLLFHFIHFLLCYLMLMRPLSAHICCQFHLMPRK